MSVALFVLFVYMLMQFDSHCHVAMSSDSTRLSHRNVCNPVIFGVVVVIVVVVVISLFYQTAQ